MTDQTQADLAGRKRQLYARLRELDTRLHGIEDEMLSHQSRDWAELATEREGDEVLASIGEEGRSEIAAIFAALKRIEEGEYGVCVRCGAEIRPARLDLLPATPFCASCAP